MSCEVRVSLAHRGCAGFVVEILCHGVSPASSSASHQRQLNGISTRRKLSQTTPPGRLQIAHRCHPRIVRCQRGWHGGARASASVDFWYSPNMNGAPLTRTRPRRSWGRGPSTSGVAAKSGPSVDVSSAASCAAPTAEPAQSAQLSVCVTLPPLVRDVVRLWLQYFPIAIPHYCRMTPGARWQ